MYSAGILLYSIHNHELYFLLGKDCKYNSWSDFGGKCDVEDGHDPLKTASREFFEETCGIFISQFHMYKILKKHGLKIPCVSFKRNNYFMYALNMDHVIHYVHPLIFANSSSMYSNQMEMMNNILLNDVSKYKEKNMIKWFTIDSILKNQKMFRSVFVNSLLKNMNIINEIKGSASL